MDTLADLLSSRKAETLRLLFGPGAGELHVREIARRAGLNEAIASPRIRAAFVFGSVAEGTEEPGSDVDLMVIGDLSLRELARKLSGVSERIGPARSTRTS